MTENVMSIPENGVGSLIMRRCPTSTKRESRGKDKFTGISQNGSSKRAVLASSGFLLPRGGPDILLFGQKLPKDNSVRWGLALSVKKADERKEKT